MMANNSDDMTADEIREKLREGMPKDIYDASLHTMNHKEETLRSQACGCYCCISIFKPQDIWEWITDAGDNEFAMCPKCKIDAVIGDASGYPINKEFLLEMNKYWFDEDIAPISGEQL